MTRSERFKPVQRISGDRERQAAQVLGESRSALEAQRQKLSELEQYRHDYYRQYEQAGSSGISAAKLMQLQRFLASLNQAIEQQKRSVEMAEHHCQQQESRWLQARSKAKAVDKVAERLSEDERLLRQRREQKESDEFAQRATPPKE